MTIAIEDWERFLVDDRAFLASIVDPIVGWLDRYAALRTIDLLRYQEQEGIAGSLYEVGLYNGKYFAILARSAAARGDKVAGFDIFAYTSRADFEALFADRFSPQILARIADLDLQLFEESSLDMDADQILARLGSRPRFISIDGSHEYDDVMWDLQTADRVMSAKGIVSADDYLNPICLGVTAAIDHFLHATPTMVPFAYVSNKLFLCRPSWADRYRGVLEEAILRDDDAEEPKSAQYRASHEAGTRQNIEARYRGHTILTVRI